MVGGFLPNGGRSDGRKGFKSLSVNLGDRSRDPCIALGSGDEAGIKLILGCGGLSYGNIVGYAAHSSA